MTNLILAFRNFANASKIQLIFFLKGNMFADPKKVTVETPGFSMNYKTLLEKRTTMQIVAAHQTPEIRKELSEIQVRQGHCHTEKIISQGRSFFVYIKCQFCLQRLYRIEKCGKTVANGEQGTNLYAVICFKISPITLTLSCKKNQVYPPSRQAVNLSKFEPGRSRI